MAIWALILSYLCWGMFPVYWKQLAHISSAEILFHRILWSFFFYGFTMVAISLFSKRGKSAVWSSNFDSKLWLKLLASSTLVTGNWFLYIYAVNSGQILQGSMAYYISPLIAVVVGALFYQEPISTLSKWALGFCALGVFILTFGNSIFLDQSMQVPWLALSLAFSFSGYGLIKKTISIPAITSSFIEGLYFVLPSIYFIFYSSNSTITSYTIHDWIYFIVGGAVTGIPLVFFSYASQRLPLATIGFFQYLSPTLQLLTALFIYSEDFNIIKILAFLCIWIGVGFYVYNLLTLLNKRPQSL